MLALIFASFDNKACACEGTEKTIVKSVVESTLERRNFIKVSI